jgi:hypothetical protein
MKIGTVSLFKNFLKMNGFAFQKFFKKRTFLLFIFLLIFKMEYLNFSMQKSIFLDLKN